MGLFFSKPPNVVIRQLSYDSTTVEHLLQMRDNKKLFAWDVSPILNGPQNCFPKYCTVTDREYVLKCLRSRNDDWNAEGQDPVEGQIYYLHY